MNQVVIITLDYNNMLYSFLLPVFTPFEMVYTLCLRTSLPPILLLYYIIILLCTQHTCNRCTTNSWFNNGDSMLNQLIFCKLFTGM